MGSSKESVACSTNIVKYDNDGNPLATTFVDYLLPTAAEVPVIEYGHIETPAPTNAGGYKGMGEGGAMASPPAVMNAVADAVAHLGVVIRDQPLGPAQVVELLTRACDPLGTKEERERRSYWKGGLYHRGCNGFRPGIRAGVERRRSARRTRGHQPRGQRTTLRQS